MRLVSPWEVPLGVDLIEYNRYKFSAEPTEEDRFSLNGLRVVKKASYRRVNRYQVDNATSHTLRKASEQVMDEVLQGIKGIAPSLVYPVA